MSGIDYRHPKEEDSDLILEVVNASNKDNPLWEVHSPKEFKKVTFENDEWDAEGHWVAERKGKVLGYGGARIFKIRQQAGLNEGWLGVWVVPDERARGVENEIVKRSLDYLREMGAAKAKDKQLKDLMTIANDAFAGDKNYAPNTLESLRKWRDASRNVVRVNFAVMDDKVVGVCISEIELEYNKLHKVRAGWTRLFGVSKKYRNRHVGKALLHDGIRWHWKQGMNTLYVGVDEMNPPAERVYRSVGFRVQDEGAIWSLDL